MSFRTTNVVVLVMVSIHYIYIEIFKCFVRLLSGVGSSKNKGEGLVGATACPDSEIH